MFRLTLTVLFLLLGACNSITFVQVEQAAEPPVVNKWHHATLNGMVEISSPLDIRDVCGDRAWAKITTEFTFYNLLAGAVVPNFGIMSFYSAWTNKVECYVVPVAETVQ